MHKRVTDKIDRSILSNSYRDTMVDYLIQTKGASRQQAMEFVDKTISSRLKVPRVRVDETDKPGVVTTRVYPLTTFLKKIHRNVVTPSGSVYLPASKKRSIVATLIEDFMNERKSVKGLMFEAYSNGDFAQGSIYKAQQNSIKVTLNSLPGGFGFPSSIFYDKGSYNAITSSGRILISTSFVCCEQFLGSNIPLFNVEECINLLMMCKSIGPSDDKIRVVMERHDLKWVTKSQVVEYLNNSLKRYSFTEDLNTNTTFQSVIDKLTPEQTQFVWYHSNMQHICFGNDELFHKQVEEAFRTDVSYANIEFNSVKDFYKLDSGILAIATTVLAQDIGGRDVGKIAKDKELSKKVVAVYNNIHRLLDNFADIFSVFIFHDMISQKVLTRNTMQRESVVVSDTDSVIYTVFQWSNWYTRQSEKVTQGSYNIAALATYWLTEANADAMAKYAISSGACGADIDLIKMKSEFMYPVLLLYDIKKVYAALVAAQEGLMFKDLRDDIKGSSIRGNGASPAAKKFTTSVLTDKVLRPVIEGQISSRELIENVVEFETVVKSDLSSGGLDFLPMTSVGTTDRYKDPSRSVYFYVDAWNSIFGGHDGHDPVNVPNSFPTVKLIKPTDQYFEWLRNKNKGVYERFKTFIERYKKTPAAMCVDPMISRIPEELMPILDIKALTYFNTNPVYLTLASLNVNIGHSKKHLLLSDIYDPVKQPKDSEAA